MKQPNSLVQISVNDVNLDSLSECAGQNLGKRGGRAGDRWAFAAQFAAR